MKWYFYFLGCLLFISCSSLDDISEDEREWRKAIDVENWELCQLAYRQEGVAIRHNHIHSRYIRWYEIRDDLVVNNCAVILGDYWIRY